MKCISLWQPWASLIAIGAKRMETRSWRTDYRGPLAIHAAKKWDRELEKLARTEPFASALSEGGIESYGLRSVLPLGKIVAVCELKAVSRVEKVTPADDDPERSFGDYTPGRYAWLLCNVRRLEQPIPWRGSQGFFEVPDHLL